VLVILYRSSVEAPFVRTVWLATVAFSALIFTCVPTYRISLLDIKDIRELRVVSWVKDKAEDY